MEKIKITQIRSTIGSLKRTKETMRALGLKKINQSVEHKVNPAILGMIKKVHHLIKIH